jgi:YhcH/YjgK/YiaL family protein
MFKITNLQDLKKHFDYLPDEAISFVENADEHTACGKYVFGEDCYVNVSECETKPETKMEGHEKYIDVQYLIFGEEKMLVCDKSALKVEKEYDAENDYAFFYFDSAEEILYKKGEAIVLYPNDAHSPDRMVTSPVVRKKAVMKIRVK